MVIATTASDVVDSDGRIRDGLEGYLGRRRRRRLPLRQRGARQKRRRPPDSEKHSRSQEAARESAAKTAAPETIRSAKRRSALGAHPRRCAIIPFAQGSDGIGFPVEAEESLYDAANSLGFARPMQR